MMKDKSLGIIGGMGPKATAVFFDKIIDRTLADRDQEHMDMIVLNHATIPDRTSVIASGASSEFLNAIAKDFALLEHAGAANIAIPCNTSHYFYNEMQAMTSIPIINMVDETLKRIHAQYGSGCRVGILATNGTINTGVYAKGCENYSMQLVEPNNEMQRQVMDIIYTDVKGHNNCDPAKLESLIDQLIHNYECQCVILACTELSCIALSGQYAAYSVDAMEVLVERAIQLSGKQYKKPKQ
ncbi:aspartate/glutamate racemase family protein [Paenibacillus sp. IITD108]|uniref:aspartate/glutamate racemase family protein n=1 Tax=Paenibacillus sp. IITD108 TaxID=3116649 RepID=UPI002F40E162